MADTYKAKNDPDHTVEAMLWKGTSTLAVPIIHWILEKGFKARYTETRQDNGSLAETMSSTNKDDTESAIFQRGQWVVYDNDHFYSWDDEKFENTFNKIEEK